MTEVTQNFDKPFLDKLQGIYEEATLGRAGGDIEQKTLQGVLDLFKASVFCSPYIPEEKPDTVVLRMGPGTYLEKQGIVVVSNGVAVVRGLGDDADQQTVQLGIHSAANIANIVSAARTVVPMIGQAMNRIEASCTPATM